jgi:hypothetical protein
MGTPAHDDPGAERFSREPDFADLASIAAELNRVGAKYCVIGGFAVIRHGYPRLTMDIDLLIDTSLENEARIIEALLILPDQAARQLKPGDVERYVVVRVGDEVTIDLMKSACGVDYREAAQDALVFETAGVRIPYASLPALWKMKQTRREKDAADLVFIRERLAEQGIAVPRPPAPIHLPAWMEKIRWWLQREH